MRVLIPGSNERQDSFAKNPSSIGSEMKQMNNYGYQAYTLSVVPTFGEETNGRRGNQLLLVFKFYLVLLNRYR